MIASLFSLCAILIALTRRLGCCRILIILVFQFSLIDTRALHGMVDVCEKHGAKLLTYGTLVSTTSLYSPFPFGFLAFLGASVLNLTIVEHVPSAEGSCLTPGWASQNRNHMIHLSLPPNERFVIHIPFRSGDPRTLTYPTDLILRSDRPDDLRCHFFPPERFSILI